MVQTDASDLGLGAVLLQEHDGVLRPVAFASRWLTPAERNYSVTEKECLAIILALRKFDCCVDGVAFVIETDHMALTWLRRLGEPGGRLARWALFVQRYNFTVCYRRGKSNVVADALSRAPVDGTKGDVAFPATLGAEAESSVAALGEVREGGEIHSLIRNDSDERIISFPEDTREGSGGGPLIQGETVNHLEGLGSAGIVFSRRDLLEAQKKDPFCQQLVDGLQEPSAAHRGAAGIAVHAGHSRAAERAASALDTYLIDSDGVLLRYIPSEKDTNESFKVVIPRAL